MVGTELRKKFLNDVENCGKPRVFVVITRLPSGALETQVNSESLGTKITYVVANYDQEFRLKTNHNVQVVGYILC